MRSYCLYLQSTYIFYIVYASGDGGLQKKWRYEDRGETDIKVWNNSMGVDRREKRTAGAGVDFSSKQGTAKLHTSLVQRPGCQCDRYSRLHHIMRCW